MICVHHVHICLHHRVQAGVSLSLIMISRGEMIRTQTMSVASAKEASAVLLSLEPKGVARGTQSGDNMKIVKPSDFWVSPNIIHWQNDFSMIFYSKPSIFIGNSTMESMFQSYRFAGSSDHPHDEDGVRESMARGKASVRSRHISPSRMGCRMSNRDAPAMGLKEKTRKRGCEHNQENPKSSTGKQAIEDLSKSSGAFAPLKYTMDEQVCRRKSKFWWSPNVFFYQVVLFICWLSKGVLQCCSDVGTDWGWILPRAVWFNPTITKNHGTLGLKIPENPKELSGKLDYVSMVLVFNLDRKPPAIGTIWFTATASTSARLVCAQVMTSFIGK